MWSSALSHETARVEGCSAFPLASRHCQAHTGLHMCRYPGHAIAASEFTGEALNGTSEMSDYGTDAFVKLACMRPVYMLTVLDLGYGSHPPEDKLAHSPKPLVPTTLRKTETSGAALTGVSSSV